MASEKILFLDWDGPIANWRQLFSNPAMVDSAAVGLINALTSAGFKTVMCATMRTSFNSPKELERFCKLHGIRISAHILWRTGCEMIRHDQAIYNYLSTYYTDRSETEIVVLDDETCTIKELEPFWYNVIPITVYRGMSSVNSNENISVKLPKTKAALDKILQSPDYRFKREKFVVTSALVESLRTTLKNSEVHSLWAGTSFLEQYLPDVKCYNDSATTLPCFVDYRLVDMLRHMQYEMQECDIILVKNGTLDRLTLLGDYLLKGQRLITYTATRFDINGMSINRNAVKDLDEVQVRFPNCYGRWVQFTKT